MPSCTNPCEHSCITPTALSPEPLCFLIDPCNEGCTELIDANCVIISGLKIFGEDVTLAEFMTEYATTFDMLAIDYNTRIEEKTDGIIRCRITLPVAPFVISVTKDTVLEFAVTVTDYNVLLAALLLLDLTWELTGNVISVKGTSQWTITIT